MWRMTANAYVFYPSYLHEFSRKFRNLPYTVNKLRIREEMMDKSLLDRAAWDEISMGVLCIYSLAYPR